MRLADLIPAFASIAVGLVPQNVDGQSPRLAVGLGLGIPYGMHGANVEYAVVENGYVSGGIGSTILAGPGYAVGARYYIKGMGSRWPRVGLFYGTTTVAEGIFDDDESFTGLTVTAGQVRTIGSHATVSTSMSYW